MPSTGFEPAIPASERPQTYALERAATKTGSDWASSFCNQLYSFVQVNVYMELYFSGLVSFSTWLCISFYTLLLTLSGCFTYYSLFINEILIRVFFHFCLIRNVKVSLFIVE
jgi:hypothetical protein